MPTLGKYAGAAAGFPLLPAYPRARGRKNPRRRGRATLSRLTLREADVLGSSRASCRPFSGKRVATPQLADRVRERLRALLADDRGDPERIVTRLRELRSVDAVPAFAAAIYLLVHLELPDVEGERLLGGILRHRAEMQAALGRDPGLRVAAVDFLSNIEHLLTNPKVVELSQFEQTERSAATDPLTRLYNRRFFQAAMEREVRRSRRYGLCFSVLMVDLDHFKGINDAYGHLLGDLVLQRVARILRRSIREADMACRYGGEEFTVVLPETDRLGALAVAERARERVHRSFSERATRGREVAVSLSGGIGCFPEDGQSVDLLLARADEALYRAKQTGRNRVVVHYADRRQSVRYPARLSAIVELGTASSGPRRAAALNVSHFGMLIETDGPLEPAEAVEVRMGPEGFPGATPAWRVPGRVARVERGPGGGRLRAGVAFDVPVPEECLQAQVGPPGAAWRGAARDER